MNKSNKEKKIFDKRRFNITYIYVYDGFAYTNAKKLCEKLGISYKHCINTMSNEDNIYTKKINIKVTKEGRKNIYKNGKFIIDLNLFCKQFGLKENIVKKDIKQKGYYLKLITIKRHQKYDIKLTYVINGKKYPLADEAIEKKL